MVALFPAKDISFDFTNPSSHGSIFISSCVFLLKLTPKTYLLSSSISIWACLGHTQGILIAYNTCCAGWPHWPKSSPFPHERFSLLDLSSEEISSGGFLMKKLNPWDLTLTPNSLLMWFPDARGAFPWFRRNYHKERNIIFYRMFSCFRHSYCQETWGLGGLLLFFSSIPQN